MFTARAAPSAPAPHDSFPRLSATSVSRCPTRNLRFLSPFVTAGATNGRIAFFSDRDGDFDIYVMNADGTGQRAITQNDTEDRDPVWSPDGLRVAYASRRDGHPEIYIADADGKQSRRLTNSSGANFNPVWSPDGRRLAFVSERATQSDIYTINADGTGERQITNDSSDDYRPAWSPDSKQVVFLSQRTAGQTDGSGEMFLVSVDGGDARLVTKTSKRALAAAFSPNGARIALFSVVARKLEIVLMAPDGSAEQNLSALAKSETDSEPAWSPDSKQLAFLSDREISGALGIFVMNADGSGARRVSAAKQATAGPASWAGDGSAVVYSGFENGNWEIFAAELATTQPRQLTVNKATDMGATWAPSGPARAGR